MSNLRVSFSFGEMKVVQQVAQYVSDSSEEQIEGRTNEVFQKKTRKKRKTKSWMKYADYDCAAAAEASIESTWSKHYTNHSEIGRKVYYRCKRKKLRGPQCKASIYLLYHADSDKVSVFKTEADHDQCEEYERGIRADVKKCINELYMDGITKPKQIIRALQSRQLETPPLRKIKNYLVQYRKTKFGNHMISLGELEHWCKMNSDIPSDDNQSFVVCYEVFYEGENYGEDKEGEESEEREEINENNFRFFISSIRLLNIASSSSHINADATYKLIWQGYPVLVIGTTDLNKAFHPFGLAICSNEKTEDFRFIFKSIQIGMQRLNKDLFKPTALVADAADAIKNAFRKVFNHQYNQIMCWSHMKTKVENRLSHIDDKVIADEILSDIEYLHLSNSKEVFDLALSLFLKKWKIKNKTKNQSIIDFLSYFDDQWIKSNSGWYEGIQLYTPSTNNALEATNRTIKHDGTYRERHVLSRFLTVASNIICNWSVERDLSSVNVKIFATEPTVSLKLWTSSYQWAKADKKIVSIQNDGLACYYIPARHLESISQAELKKYTGRNWTTFNQFKKSFDIWCLEMNDSNWKKSKCNCPGFLKNYICKHVVGMAIRLKHCKPPAEAKTVPLGEKRKRGRPSKAKPALLVQ